MPPNISIELSAIAANVDDFASNFVFVFLSIFGRLSFTAAAVTFVGTFEGGTYVFLYTFVD